MSCDLIDQPLAGLFARAGSAAYGVFDHGAHVFAWTPEGGRPVLWMSGESRFERGAAVRGGVPVCFPWFGGGPKGDAKPAHGFARVTDWTRDAVADSTERDGRLVVEYRLDSAMAGAQPLFPHAFEAHLRADFARDYVQIDLEVKNTGETPFAFEEALHSYLAVGDARRIRVEGLEGAAYLDKTAGGARRDQSGAIEIVGESDRIYLSSGAVAVVDPEWGRRIVVTKGGSAQTVIWNPWIDKARAIADFGDDEWTGMICVEAANALDHAVRVSPGASHRLWQRIAVQAL